MNVTHEIVLDVNIDTLETINIKQYTKNSHILHIRLTENGVDYPIDSNTVKCQFKMLTPNKNHILTDAVINSDGTITVTLPEASCLAPGNGTAELLFIQPKNSDTNYDYVLLSMTFNINIIKSVYNHDDIVPYDDFDALNQALVKVNKDYEYVMASAQKSADDAKQFRRDTEELKNTAEQCKNDASGFASTAQSAAGNAASSANNALQYSNNAKEWNSFAKGQADNAANSATLSQSYAVGDTNTRPNEENDNAKHYYNQAKYFYEQAQTIADSFSGALRPMGTISFANLPALSNAAVGDMYNISDQFTTNANFKEGSGSIIPAGSNVYKTADGKWDVLSGTPVTGIKGSAESSYRKGNVNLTAANVGALPTNTKYAASDSVGGAANNLKHFKCTSSSSVGMEDTDSNAIAYTHGNGSVPIPNAGNEGAIYKQVYSTSWVHEIFGDYRTGQLAVRGKNDGIWQSWRRILDNTNFKDYVTKSAIGLGNVDNVEDANKSVNYATSAGSAAKSTKDGNGNVITSTYLPLSGGTITGNLRLKGSGNYGNTLNFGDGDYIHLSEPTDDHLEIKASYINFVLPNTNSGRFTINGNDILSYKNISPYITVTTNNFTLNSAYCENGVAVIEGTVKDGFNGSGTLFSISENMYIPRTEIMASFTYSSQGDLGKIAGIYLTSNGVANIWAVNALAHGSYVSFVYPIRTS